MKIIIFLVLAGLSLAQDEINCPEPPTPKNKEECALEALKGVSSLTKSYTTFACNYNGTFDDNKENHDKVARDYLTAMACAGCLSDEWIGTNKTFEDLYRDAGNLVSETLILVDKLLDILGLTKVYLTLICKLAGGALASQCLDNILTKNTPEILHALEDLSCKGDTDELTTDQMIDLMTANGRPNDKISPYFHSNGIQMSAVQTLRRYLKKESARLRKPIDNLTCFGEDALHTKDALKVLLTDIGEDAKPALTGALDTIKNGLAGTDLVNGLTCKVAFWAISGGDSIINLGVDESLSVITGR